MFKVDPHDKKKTCKKHVFSLKKYWLIRHDKGQAKIKELGCHTSYCSKHSGKHNLNKQLKQTKTTINTNLGISINFDNISIINAYINNNLIETMNKEPVQLPDSFLCNVLYTLKNESMHYIKVFLSKQIKALKRILKKKQIKEKAKKKKKGKRSNASETSTVVCKEKLYNQKNLAFLVFNLYMFIEIFYASFFFILCLKNSMFKKLSYQTKSLKLIILTNVKVFNEQ
ncbi:hypothetical protein RFI_04310 [Reticulomyxa filosa]|uniref:Uncharacterized protein n=1 Tax=Reticulomyxa filosa TaxID=46433 RepID=X6P3N0_RETFI|nr:hypothetical protein RFI_04310 [Reticulomyxa filosa]|eukprot:ETO32806.1 hypothetical protein RFI_04310 [Reticulomyxa filosa]